jgi:hypothetical protein
VEVLIGAGVFAVLWVAVTFVLPRRQEARGQGRVPGNRVSG